jgi:two-component system copper resistance phosphate regulon response regulator CusR
LKILVVEDEANVVSFIKKGLEEQHYHVEVAYDGQTAVRLAMQSDFDLIIMDVIIPQLNGIEACRKIKEFDKKMPVIMLTALRSTDDIVTGLDAGADDYLTKPFKFKELLARVRALSRRKSLDDQSMAFRIADLEVDLDYKTVKRGGKPITLTSKEFSLLEYFVKNKGRILSRVQILDNVWEVDFDMGTNVVDVYINYLRNKIDKGFSPKLIHTVIGMGYVLKEDDPE